MNFFNKLKSLNKSTWIVMIVVFVLGGVDALNAGGFTTIHIPGEIIAILGIVGTWMHPTSTK